MKTDDFRPGSNLTPPAPNLLRQTKSTKRVGEVGVTEMFFDNLKCSKWLIRIIRKNLKLHFQPSELKGRGQDLTPTPFLEKNYWRIYQEWGVCLSWEFLIGDQNPECRVISWRISCLTQNSLKWKFQLENFQYTTNSENLCLLINSPFWQKIQRKEYIAVNFPFELKMLRKCRMAWYFPFIAILPKILCWMEIFLFWARIPKIGC